MDTQMLVNNLINPHCYNIVLKMFFETADINYISARAAFFDQRDWDFWWLILHALEKYLKSIILMNGKSAKDGGHDLKKLLNQVKDIDDRLVLPTLVCPDIAGAEWNNYPDAKFLDRLSTYGNPNNRYGLYGYSTYWDDLFRADQIRTVVKVIPIFG